MYKAFQGTNGKSSSSSFHLKFRTTVSVQSITNLTECLFTVDHFESSIQISECVYVYQRGNVFFLHIHNKATQSYFNWQKNSDILCLCESLSDYHGLLSPKLSLFLDYTEQQQSSVF